MPGLQQRLGWGYVANISTFALSAMKKVERERAYVSPAANTWPAAVKPASVMSRPDAGGAWPATSADAICLIPEFAARRLPLRLAAWKGLGFAIRCRRCRRGR